MSVPPPTEAEFNASIERLARGSKLTGLLALVGLVIVLGALAMATSQLVKSRRELTTVDARIAERQQHLVGLEERLRSTRTALVRDSLAFAAYRAEVREQSQVVAAQAARVAQDSVVQARVVYIQFRGFPRGIAEELRARLNASGLNAPGVERVDREYSNSVRYFHPEDAQAARELARTAAPFFAERGCRPENFPVEDHSRRESAPRGQVEIWINLTCRPAPPAG